MRYTTVATIVYIISLINNIEVTMSSKQTDRLFIGCLHLDSNYAIKYRPYAPQDKVEYNNFIINQINKFTTENTQLYLLGDVCDSKNSWKLLGIAGRI